MHAFVPVLFFLVQIAGGVFSYAVQPGDSLTSIGARFGVDARVLAEANELKLADRLRSGQTLRIDNRHIAPASEGAELVVNLPQRMLFRFEAGSMACGFPIAAGKPDWRTPTGDFEVISKREDPVWHVPPSIQDEMRQNGQPVLTVVPHSPENPLGDYWIGLSLPGIGVHGTNAPSSIYRLATHGCIRLHPDDIRTLFSKIEPGARGRVIYESVLIAREGDSIFLEVHPDAYKKSPDPLQRALELARARGFADMLDLALVRDVVRRRDGIARDVTRR